MWWTIVFQRYRFDVTHFSCIKLNVRHQRLQLMDVIHGRLALILQQRVDDFRIPLDLPGDHRHDKPFGPHCLR